MPPTPIAVRFRPGSETLSARLIVLTNSVDTETARLARVALNGHDGKGFVSGTDIEAALATLTNRKLI
jgi:hypothetical protein